MHRSIDLEKYEIKMMNSQDLLSPKNGVSIIVCSYNGSHKLRPTLTHIAKQNLQSGCPVELIYIDNASTDGSIDTVRETWAKVGRDSIPLKVYVENKPGKYFALQTAIRHASYAFFIICDDDNWLAPDYVDRAYRSLVSNHQIGALGGRTFPAFADPQQEIPDWFVKDAQRYAIGSQGDKTGDVTKRKQLWGAGMVSRTHLYRSFYDTHPSLFLRENDQSGHFVAEDTEYCLRLILRGYQLHYDKDLILQHFVPSERLVRSYNESLNQKIEDSFMIIEKYNLATKLYGEIAYDKINKLRLKLLTPIRLLMARSLKSKARNQTLFRLLFPSWSKKDHVIEEIRSFAHDTKLPRSI
ncbi:glycosyltransferase [Sphingobacterium suaedae]|uniref:Glycosyltransferase n=1 Tax=Sphingobacterium suaedae TaxID=1686402 RepID=A0ABW5KKX2_9SPHI